MVLKLLEMAGDEGQRFRAQVDDLKVTRTYGRDLMVDFNDPPEDGVEVVASAGVATDIGGFILLFSNRADRLVALEYVPLDDRMPKDWPDAALLRPVRGKF